MIRRTRPIQPSTLWFSHHLWAPMARTCSALLSFWRLNDLIHLIIAALGARCILALGGWKMADELPSVSWSGRSSSGGRVETDNSRYEN